MGDFGLKLSGCVASVVFPGGYDRPSVVISIPMPAIDDDLMVVRVLLSFSLLLRCSISTLGSHLRPFRKAHVVGLPLYPLLGV